MLFRCPQWSHDLEVQIFFKEDPVWDETQQTSSQQASWVSWTITHGCFTIIKSEELPQPASFL